MSEEPATIIARQRAKRNSALGLLAGALATSMTIIVHLVQMQQADAEKRVLAERAASATIDADSIDRKLDTLRKDMAVIRDDIVTIRERTTRVETRLDERGKR